MEIKINREIMNYKEILFFGLTMRQFLCSMFACAFDGMIYFLLKPYMSIDIISWICILMTIPFAVFGFVTYNGMTAEQFIVAWIRFRFVIPRRFTFQPNKAYLSYIKRERDSI